MGLGTVPAFDLTSGCSGFLYGLGVASSLVTAGTFDSVLLVASDVFSAFLDPQDWLMSAIFGDGAGAVVLRAGEAGTPGALGPFDLGSDGTQADLLEIPGGGARAKKRKPAAPDEGSSPYFRMDGPAVLKQAVVGMCDSVTRAVDRAGWLPGDLDLLIAHQANQRILDGLTAELGLAPGQVLSHIERYGNTAAASVPVLLAQAAAAGTLSPGLRVALTAYGAGLAWGSTTLVWPDVRAVAEEGDPASRARRLPERRVPPSPFPVHQGLHGSLGFGTQQAGRGRAGGVGLGPPRCGDRLADGDEPFRGQREGRGDREVGEAEEACQGRDFPIRGHASSAPMTDTGTTGAPARTADTANPGLKGRSW